MANRTKPPRIASGQRYGRLTAVKFFDRGTHGHRWKFACECGTSDFICYASKVRLGRTSSCGCIKAEIKSGRPHLVADRIRKNTEVNQKTGCWEWTASKTSSGYGKIFVVGRLRAAHRVSYELRHGPIQDGMHVLHRCDNPSCINPDHLFLGTDADNAADKVAKGRQPRGSWHYKAKISEDDVLAILSAKNEAPKNLAMQFGVSPSTISLIRSGKIWSHVRCSLSEKG